MEKTNLLLMESIRVGSDHGLIKLNRKNTIKKELWLKKEVKEVYRSLNWD